MEEMQIKEGAELKNNSIYNSVEDNRFCCGCRSCEQICPKQAVSIQYDKEGFLKASVDGDVCIQCGLCRKVCPAINKNTFASPMRYFAAVHKQDQVIRRSSSGGIFSALADYVLKQNGSVYGCRLDENLIPIQSRIVNADDLDLLRRSKYIQSDTRQTFSQVKKDLLERKMVLYVGTPCQIAALRAFLQKPYEKLYCVDLICHGVPSAQFFQKNIEYWSRKLNSPVEKYEFRLKPSEHYYYYFFFLACKNGATVQKPYFYDPYYEAFYNFKNYNEMCYQCQYACIERVGDITIGDYSWAVNHHPDLCERNNGKTDAISCVLVNSEAGKSLLNVIKDTLVLYETKREWITERNKNLIRPTVRPNTRDTFYVEVEKLGYNNWARKYYLSEAFIKNIPVFSYVFRAKNKLKKIIYER